MAAEAWKEEASPRIEQPGRLAQALVGARLLADRVRARLDTRERGLQKAFAAIRRRFYHDLWFAAAEEIGARAELLEADFIRITRGARATWVRGGFAMIDPLLAFRLSENKPLVMDLMRELGAPTVPYRRFSLDRIEEAEAFLSAAAGPVVVKPAAGTGAGAGVVTGIRTAEALRTAAVAAARLHPQLLVEQEISGAAYRLLYLRGELVDVIRRGPPTVVADGRRNLEQLIEAENAARGAADPVTSLHPISFDVECRAALERQGLAPDTVPPDGERVAVKLVCNQNAARDNLREPTDAIHVHPTIRDEGRRLAAALGLELVGVDLIAEHLRAPLAETGGFIGELNAGPGLHHHVLVSEPDDFSIGRIVLEHVFEHGTTVPALGSPD